jgi:hypothetical protein
MELSLKRKTGQRLVRVQDAVISACLGYNINAIQKQVMDTAKLI